MRWPPGLRQRAVTVLGIAVLVLAIIMVLEVLRR
jgi:hypothetical protein